MACSARTGDAESRRAGIPTQSVETSLLVQQPQKFFQKRRVVVPGAGRDEVAIDDAWFEGAETVGVTSGASAPERLVERVCDWFRARGVEAIEPYRMVDEDVTFKLPVELRRELALAETRVVDV